MLVGDEGAGVLGCNKNSQVKSLQLANGKHFESHFVAAPEHKNQIKLHY